MVNVDSKSHQSEKRRKPRRKRFNGHAKGGPGGRRSMEDRRTHLEDKPTEAPLSQDEKARMLENLAFIRQHRKVLRLKLNAAEDLLVNGVKAPEERGVCLHLLAKVDLATVKSALVREPLASDPKCRLELLEGAASFGRDDGVLLLYLEALTEVEKERAANAFKSLVNRLSAPELSAARLSRLLSIVLQTFKGQARTQTLWQLLCRTGWRKLLEKQMGEIEGSVRAEVLPLFTAYHALFLQKKEGDIDRDKGRLVEGLSRLLEAFSLIGDAFHGWRLEALVRTIRRDADHLMTRPQWEKVLSRLDPHRSSAQSILWNHTSFCVRRGDDKNALFWAKRIVKAAPEHRPAQRLLQALESPRLGPFAFIDERKSDASLEGAYWLLGQQPIWLRQARGDDVARLKAEATLHRTLCLPGILPVVEEGLYENDTYCVALAGYGRPLSKDSPGRRCPWPLAVTLAWQGMCFLRALSWVGVRLPDMSPHRFVGDTRKPGGHLFLADLHGAQKGDAKEILDHHQRLAVKWCRQCFATIPFTDAPMRRDVPDTLATWLKEPDHETAFTTWLQALHKAFGWLG